MSESSADRNERVGWVDIPVADVERAAKFYRAVLAIGVEVETFGEQQVGILQHGPGNGGCLVKPQGGEVLEDVNSIGPHGFRAVIVDSEGNRVALHSNVDA